MTSPLAGALLAPTVAWVAVASSLNLDIWYLNRNKNK
jgi:tryptophan-rich sensory protein